MDMNMKKIYRYTLIQQEHVKLNKSDRNYIYMFLFVYVTKNIF